MYSPMYLEYFQLEMSKSTRQLLSVRHMQSWALKQGRKASQGRGGMLGFEKWEDFNLSKKLQVQEDPSKKGQGGEKSRAKEGIWGEAVMGPEVRGLGTR